MESENIDAKTKLILTAQRIGFGVSEGEDGWLVHVPARPRHPANVQGSFKSSERAWMAAASLAMEWPDCSSSASKKTAPSWWTPSATTNTKET